MRERVVGLREEDEEDIGQGGFLWRRDRRRSSCRCLFGLPGPAAIERVGGHTGSGNHHVERLRNGGRNGEPGERLSGALWAFRLGHLGGAWWP